MTATDPAALFAAHWPDARRYAGRVAWKVAAAANLDADDLLGAAGLAVWRLALRGKLAAHPDPVRVACRAAGWAVLKAAKRERRHLRRRAPAADRPVGEDGDGGGLDWLPARPEADAGGFAELLALAPAGDRELLARRFRDDLPATAIAEATGETAERVRKRLARAVEVIGQGLRDAG